MKRLLLSMLIGFSLTVSDTASAAGPAEYPLVAFDEGWKKELAGDEVLRSCGDYFGAADTTEGKLVYFRFLYGASEVLALTTISQVVVAFNEEMLIPSLHMLFVNGERRFVLTMSSQDFTDSLPCLGSVGRKA
jgi:hypothetical protein